MSIFNPLQDIYISLTVAFWPTFWRVWANPSLLLHPAEISRIFFSHVWTTFGPGIDGNNTGVKTSLVTQNAYGIVLDIGAGHGHTIKYLDTTRVTKYVALEPNIHMHPEIRRAAHAARFTEADGTFVLLSCGAQDTATILTALGGYQPVDTIVSILTLCSVPTPQDIITSLVREVLQPGGQLLFFEHVRNSKAGIAWWQTCWSPLWSRLFDGCRLDRPTHVWVQQVGGWAHGEVTGLEGEDEDSLFCYRVGRFIKTA